MCSPQPSQSGQSSITVTLDQENAVYSAGDLLKGEVIFDLKKDIRIKGIKVLFTGAARVSWDEQRAYTKGSAPSVVLKNSEVLLNHTVQLLKKEAGQVITSKQNPVRKKSIFACGPIMEDDGITINAGINKYPFELALPRNLPSSFEGRWGSIQYGVKITIEKSIKNVERFVFFTVKGHYDFNDDPDVLRPLAGQETFNLSGFCWNSGKLIVDIRLAKKGFVTGEIVPFMVEITNDSGQGMRDSKVALMQHVIFRVSSSVKRSTTVLKAFPGGAIEAGTTKRWEDEVLCIPENAVPSCTRDVKAIQIKYTLSVFVKSGRWNRDYNFPVNLVIGTVPVRPLLAQRYLAVMGLANPSLQNIDSLLTRQQNIQQPGTSRQNSGRDSLAVPVDIDELSRFRRTSTCSIGTEATNISASSRSKN